MNDKPKRRPRPAQSPQPATTDGRTSLFAGANEALQQSLDRRW